MVTLVAMIEADLEIDALHDLRFDPVRLGHAQTVDQKGVSLLEIGGGEHRVSKANALGEETSRHERSAQPVVRVGQAMDQLDPHPPRCRGAFEVEDFPIRDFGRCPIDQWIAGVGELLRMGRKRLSTCRFESEHCRVAGGAAA